MSWCLLEIAHGDLFRVAGLLKCGGVRVPDTGSFRASTSWSLVHKAPDQKGKRLSAGRSTGKCLLAMVRRA